MGSKGKGKKALGIGGTVLLIVVVLGVKMFTGVDLLDNQSGQQQTNTQHTDQRDDRSAARTPTSKGDNRYASKPTKATKKARTDTNTDSGSWTTNRVKSEDDLIERLFRNKQSDEILTIAGMVIKSLPDDNEGDRHQRFIVKLASGRTILIAHNIDLAPRVPLREGDRITVHGEYEWSERGGVIHWTHKDPKQWREGGWIDHNGKRYE